MNDREPYWKMPGWLREMGSAGWYALGAVAAVLIVAVLFALFAEITIPLVFAAIIGAVFSPWVDWLVRHKVKRAPSALLMLLLLVVVGVAFVILVGSAVVKEWPEIQSQAQAGIEKIATSIDQNTTEEQSQELTEQIEDGVASAVKGLAGQIPQLIGGFAGLVFMLFIMANIVFFMLKDGSLIGDWVARRARRIAGGEGLARRLLNESGEAMRRYIFGVGMVAFFNAVVVGIGAWALGVPLAGVIAIVTFAFAFIPYIGAVIAGAFAVVMAISTSPTAAISMLLLVIVANGGLQTVVNQMAMKHALQLHPLVVLIVTLLGGVVAGAFGAFLAAPVTAIVINATSELQQAGVFSGGDGPVEAAAAAPVLDGSASALDEAMDRAERPEE